MKVIEHKVKEQDSEINRIRRRQNLKNNKQIFSKFHKFLKV
jgi:hypothetical protein